MEKLTLSSNHALAREILNYIGEKVSFQVSEHNSKINQGLINGKLAGFLVSATTLVEGTVYPKDLEYPMEDYNWYLTECRNGNADNAAVMLVVTGLPKAKKRGNDKIELHKFTFEVVKNSPVMDKFTQERATETLSALEVCVKDGEIALTFEGEVIAKFDSTSCDVEPKDLTSLFKKEAVSVHLGALKENGKLMDVVVPINQQELISLKQATLSSKLEDKVEWIVSNNITTRENLKDILGYLTACGVDVSLQEKVLDTYKVYPKEVRAAIKPKPPVPFVDQYGFIKTSVAAIVKEKHLRYDGPKGAGKNLAIDTLSWVFQRPLFRVSFNKQTDEGVLFGEKTLATKTKRVTIEEVSENARTGETVKVFAKNMTNLIHAMLGKSQDVVFERGPLTLAMEYGGFLNLDEINFANQANASVLNNALDDNRSVYVPGYKTVVAAENFVAISTMNDGYVGTSQMNQALRDRFYPVMFEYPSDMSTFLKVRYPNANPNYLSAIDSIYEDMVKHVRDIEDLDPDAISTRGFIDVMDLADDLGLEEALIGAIVNRADNEDTRDLLRNIIDMHV